MFNEAIITTNGLELDAKIRSGLTTAKFTHVKLGDGVYDDTEDLNTVTGLKSIRQEFGISSITIIDNKTVRLRIVSNNVGIDTGYYISELGIYAEDPDKGEILYSIALGVTDKMDYQPSEIELSGATSTFDTYTSVSNVSTAIIEIGTGAAASAEDVQALQFPKLPDQSDIIPNIIFNGKQSIEYILAVFEYVRNSYANREDLMSEANNSIHRENVLNNVQSGLGMYDVMGAILGQIHDNKLQALESGAVMKSMMTNQNIDSLDTIPTSYLLYKLNSDLLEKCEDLLDMYNELNSNLNNKTVTSSGLTATWGSITGGGYTVVGNIVILNVRIVTNSILNANTSYPVNGFPAPVSDGMNGIVAITNDLALTKGAYVDSNGVLVFVPNSQFTTGSVIKLQSYYIKA